MDVYEFSASLAPERSPLLKSALTPAQSVYQAGRNTDTAPTKPQQEAGNYKKGKVRLHGLEISIENPKGSTRSGTDPNGKSWSVTMQHHYSYIKGTVGKDKDHVDVFIGPSPDIELAFVINQVEPDTGKFDEHKAVFGAKTKDEAKQIYLSNYEDDWQGLGSIKSMSIDDFKQWLDSGDQTKEAIHDLEASDSGSDNETVVAADSQVGGQYPGSGAATMAEKAGEELGGSQGNPAAGIPSRSDYGQLERLKPGEILDYIVQRHEAERAGPHRDIRIGDAERGLYSFASRKDLPQPGERRLAVRQPLHSYDYGDFEGEIPEGYGKGRVTKEDAGKVLITKIEPGKVHLTRVDKKNPERFVLVKPDSDNFGEHDWLLMNTTPTEAPDYKKIHYKKIPADKVEDALSQIEEGDNIQTKIDGASSLVKLTKDGVELLSYRAQKDSGRPIVHTERFFGNRPGVEVPKHLQGTVLRGEIYGEQGDGDKKQISSSQLSGLLNASPALSLQKQKEQNIKLRNMLFDVQQMGNKPVDFESTPYEERLKFIDEVLPYLPDADRFHKPHTLSPDDAKQVWQRIIEKTKQEGRHDPAEEGLVVHKRQGKPVKLKPRPETDVYITGTFPGEGKRQSTLGGLTYALEPEGDTIGRVGTGLSDQDLQELSQMAGDLPGRYARISFQEQLPSGAYRAPSFLGLHEDYPQVDSAKTADDSDNVSTLSESDQIAYHLKAADDEFGRYWAMASGRDTEVGDAHAGNASAEQVKQVKQGDVSVDSVYPAEPVLQLVHARSSDCSAGRDGIHDDAGDGLRAVPCGSGNGKGLRQSCGIDEEGDNEIGFDGTGEGKAGTEEGRGPATKYGINAQAKKASQIEPVLISAFAVASTLVKQAEDGEHTPTVAVDLDGTLATHYDEFDPDSIPDPRPGAKKWMNRIKDLGVRIIIFTVRGNDELVEDWLNDNDIPFDYINENPDQPDDSSDKVMADVYVDDRGVNAKGRWASFGPKVIDLLENA